MSLKDVPRLLRTLSRLRPSQIYWRGRYLVRRRNPFGNRHASVARANEDTSEADEFLQMRAVARASPLVDLVPPTCDDADAFIERLSRGAFRHLNEERQLGRPPDWLLGPCEHGRLWTVTLHYHHWAWRLATIVNSRGPLAERASELFRELVSDWIDRCDLSQPGARPLAWNAYAVATRIGWWVQSAVQLDESWWADSRPFAGRFAASLRKQAQFLVENIEWDLRGNHLVRDAVGLAWAGRFFQTKEAAGWLQTATHLADRQAAEQVLADGGHFERSPMYHAHVMSDFITLSKLITDVAVKDRLRGVIERMSEFAEWMRHPDEGFAQMNDTALDTETLGDFATHPQRDRPRGGRHFADTGIAAWHGSPWTLFFDVGPIGPDDQPGHSHADNLTLECSFAGVRLFVDPGAYSYDHDERRAYDRSTAAHNTVCVDERNSSEVWHIFRVGRRAKPLDVRVRCTSAEFDVSAAHDGYARLDGVIHRRHVRIADANTLMVIDRLEARGRHSPGRNSTGRRSAEGGWLLGPGWTATSTAGGWNLLREGQSLRVALQGPAELQLSIETRSWHPEFGVERAVTRLVWRWQGNLPLELTTSVTPQL